MKVISMRVFSMVMVCTKVEKMDDIKESSREGSMRAREFLCGRMEIHIVENIEME